MTETAPASGARLAILLGGLGFLVIVAALGALFIGSARVPPGDVLAVLTGRIKGVDQVVVLSLRLPRILAALLAGGALAMAGAQANDKKARTQARGISTGSLSVFWPSGPNAHFAQGMIVCVPAILVAARAVRIFSPSMDLARSMASDWHVKSDRSIRMCRCF